MDVEVIRLGETLGLGGVLAGGMFWFYRRDSIDAREKLEAINRDYHTLLGRVLSVLEQLDPPRKRGGFDVRADE